MSFSNNGQYAAFGFNTGRLVLWDVNRGRVVTLLAGHKAAITSINFDPKDEFLITASYDRTARIWKLDQLQELPIILSDHLTWLLSADFSSDSRQVITGEFGKTLKVYPVDMTSLTKGLCRQIGRNMTEKEWQNFVGEDIEYKKTCE